MLDNNIIFIGDNYKIMKNQNFSSIVNEINMIYIDPPYNTTNKFSYSDAKKSSEWLDFMKTRLQKAYEYLSETGVIFISIDDNEYANLKVLCDKIFNKENFVGTFITQQAKRSNAKYINTVHEYIICYAKNKNKLQEFKIKRVAIPEDKKMIQKITSKIKKIYLSKGEEFAYKELGLLIKKCCSERNISWLKNYSSIDDNGDVYFGKDLSTPSNPREVNIPKINLHLKPLRTRGWASDSKLIALHNQNRLVFKGKRPYEKHLLIDSEDNVGSILNFYSRQGTNDLNKLGLRNVFDTPKPAELIKFLIRISTKEDDTILDFFAGSGTTAQAIYEINQEDNSNRHYVLIQLDEKVNEDTKVYQACKNHNINPLVSDILLYRIKRYLESSKTDDNPYIIKVQLINVNR